MVPLWELCTDTAYLNSCCLQSDTAGEDLYSCRTSLKPETCDRANGNDSSRGRCDKLELKNRVYKLLPERDLTGNNIKTFPTVRFEADSTIPHKNRDRKRRKFERDESELDRLRRSSPSKRVELSTGCRKNQDTSNNDALLNCRKRSLEVLNPLAVTRDPSSRRQKTVHPCSDSNHQHPIQSGKGRDKPGRLGCRRKHGRDFPPPAPKRVFQLRNDDYGAVQPRRSYSHYRKPIGTAVVALQDKRGHRRGQHGQLQAGFDRLLDTSGNKTENRNPTSGDASNNDVGDYWLHDCLGGFGDGNDDCVGDVCNNDVQE
ncbi:hypothetical protein PoB_006267000 [Plakobranchus ocellatus]|uniref:Uncharacterized protein n=1 Tax=Plakobranchus ocellatus TaxID=259542 RepID=A0AAV4CWD5_9GAST|nr:hypothetical protein PoB_006267000 [Plakobranchus ocellatus]